MDSLFDEASNDLDVVHAEYLDVETISWQKLFKGYDKLYAITYSSGIDFVCKLLSHFKYAEIIFGFEGVLSFNMQEIVAYQTKTIERLKEITSKNKIDLLAKIDSETLLLRVARKQLSHEKIYLLESDDGRKRVVMGSANMSHSAFSGKQRENICYMDGEQAFAYYKDSYDTLKETSSDSITHSALSIDNSISENIEEHLEEIPISETVEVKKALVIEPSTEIQNEIKFALDIKSLANKLAPFIPKPEKNGLLRILPETIKNTKRRLLESSVQKQDLRGEYPRLEIDLEFQRVTLNNALLDLNPPKDKVAKDAELFLEYMRGYERFYGDFGTMQFRYYAFANWFFASPFMAFLRTVAIQNNHNWLPYPVFGLVYGHSKAGKTSFLETLLKMMIGQKPKIAAPDFTRSSIDGLKHNIIGAPIIVDDLTQNRFKQHAVETIKNDEFGVADNVINYPAVVISANEDVQAVSPEIARRTVICRVQAGLKNTDLIKNNIVRRIQKQIGTSFYREYLRKMLSQVPELIEILKGENDENAPDILAASSEVLFSMFKEYAANTLPPYIRPISLEDYFSEQITGEYVIKTIKDAWQFSKGKFEIQAKKNILRYNAVEVYEAKNIIKELPEDVVNSRSGEWVVMNLDKAREYFKEDFKKRLFQR